MENLFIYPYNSYSKSVHALRKAIDGSKIIRHKDSKYIHNKKKNLLNWGSTSEQIKKYSKYGPVINPPSSLSICANKKKFFNAMEGKCSIPEFTDKQDLAEDWAKEGVVVGRQKLTGHSGEGIVLSDTDINWLDAKLWVKYIPKKEEYRVHVFNGKIIDIAQKKLKDLDNNGMKVNREFVNWKIRSHKNGFIFARQDVVVPQDVRDQALASYHAVPGLDFGAFDVIWNQKYQKAYVLECNTAPGLEGQTLDNYVNAIKEMR